MKTDEKKQEELLKQEKQGLKENAINIKEKKSDGKEINPQVKQKRERHQPRDKA